jgi:hypothetical protein
MKGLVAEGDAGGGLAAVDGAVSLEMEELPARFEEGGRS